MIVIFDVDGTLIDGEETDWGSFNSAFQEVAGFPFTYEYWQSIEEVTAKAIVHQALPHLTEKQRNTIETLVRDLYLANLTAAVRKKGEFFSKTVGSALLMDHLQSMEGVDVAIATGDWRETINFKLKTAGWDLRGLSMATSSDRYSRSDIITLAAERAERRVKDAVYVGDGTWDFKACQQLGIPFIGVGKRVEELSEAGAQYVLPDLETEPFMEVIAQITAKRSQK